MKKLAVLASFSGEGGVERMLLNLVTEFCRRDLHIDLLSIKTSSQHLQDLPSVVRQIHLRGSHALTSIPGLRRYFASQTPDALLVAKDRAGRAALVARGLAGQHFPVVIRLGTNLSAALQRKNAFQRWLRLQPMRWLYPLVDKVVAVSEGVAADVQHTTGLSRDRIVVLRNPVVTPRLKELAEAACPHAWLAPAHATPVIVGAGRLTTQKDFPSLVQAFASLRDRRPARLIILGEGEHRADIARLVQQLNLRDAVLLPGFQANPYAWMGRADLFVLSSRWEGSPNVLTEALALGVPAVATDCPSGPSEILAQGRFGPLVSVGDVDGLALAMQQVLDRPLPAVVLQQAVADYVVESSASRYLETLGLA